METLPKRPDLGKIEEKWRAFWKKEKIYKFNIKSGKNIFSIDVPPITPSGRMHIGHVMSYTHFEYIARYKRMLGYEVFFPTCFDDNGLPTEKYVEETKKVSKATIERNEFRKMCFNIATELELEYSKIFEALGFSWDRDLLYRTIDNFCQKQAQRSFIDLYKKGEIYRKEEPTIWCPFHQTALAQAEVDDKERITNLNYLTFELSDGEKIKIATTRPELLPACVGIVVHPEDKRYRNYIGRKAFVPIFGQEVEIFADEKVDPDFGTGVVMICTFGDKTDIEWWKIHDLPLRICITKDGKMNEMAKQYEGMTIEEAREKIISDLKEKGILYKQEELKQNVGVCWRCKTPVEFIVTKQWFVNILKHKEKLIEIGRKVNWYPKFYRRRYEDWVNNLKWDWCISRQRYYGVPFPVWYCKNCGEVVLAEDEKLPVDPGKDNPKKCPKCGSNEFIPELDVFDTWFTSSITPLINSKWKEDEEFFEKIFPMSLRPQGHDIIRTWAFYTILKSYLHLDKQPWKDIMISGHGLDRKGKKMSKSLGNIIDPLKIIEKYCADAIRLWATTAKIGEDLPFREEDLKHNMDILIKLWNASRFIHQNIEKLKKPELTVVDRWILTRFGLVIEDYHKYFGKYELSEARRIMEMFFKHEFCDFYLEIVKYRIYGEDEKSKLSAKWTLYNVLLGILKLFAPFIPYLTEEIYQILFKETEKDKSIHLSNFPEKIIEDREALKTGMLLKEVISEVRRWKISNRLSLGKQISKIEIAAKKEDIKKLKRVLPDIKGTNRVEEVSFREGNFEVICHL